MASILSRLGLTGASYTGLLLVAAPPAEGDNCASFWAITAEHRRIHIVASGQRLKARCSTLRSQGVVRVVDMLVFIKPTCSVENDVSVLLGCVPFNSLPLHVRTASLHLVLHVVLRVLTRRSLATRTAVSLRTLRRRSCHTYTVNHRISLTDAPHNSPLTPLSRPATGRSSTWSCRCRRRRGRSGRPFAGA